MLYGIVLIICKSTNNISHNKNSFARLYLNVIMFCYSSWAISMQKIGIILLINSNIFSSFALRILHIVNTSKKRKNQKFLF